MIYFKVFYDFVKKIKTIEKNFTQLKFVLKKEKNQEVILIYINKKDDLYNLIFNSIKSNTDLNDNEITYIINNIHIILWKDPWVKCRGFFDISGKTPDEKNFKIWYHFRSQKYKTNENSFEYYIRASEPNKCKYVYTDKNIEITEKYKKTYTKIKNILFDELKYVVDFLDY
jgi:hypothetical protein